MSNRVGPTGLLHIRFKFINELVEDYCAIVKLLSLKDIAQLTGCVRRQQLSDVEVAWSTFRRDGQYSNEIQTEISEVCERFLTEWLIVQLCSDQPEATQGSGTGAEFCHGCRREGQFGSNDNLLHLSPSGQEYGDGAPDVLRELTHCFRQLGGKDFAMRHAATEQSLDGGKLTGTQSGGLTVNFRNGRSPF